ncbi:hypothetical protein WN944_006718 [Citrus x changshan-huyou]|uniref:Uncharacterized protein n=1 Tax=Citrus x changshan-huyou TaxID=2935761 RepID=A0AAP0MLV6_9ROSI
MPPLCHDDERSALLQFKESRISNDFYASKFDCRPTMASWKPEEAGHLLDMSRKSSLTIYQNLFNYQNHINGSTVDCKSKERIRSEEQIMVGSKRASEAARVREQETPLRSLTVAAS